MDQTQNVDCVNNGRTATPISFPGSSPTLPRGRVGEDPGNELASAMLLFFALILFFHLPLGGIKETVNFILSVLLALS